jgi:hypothetical protein
MPHLPPARALILLMTAASIHSCIVTRPPAPRLQPAAATTRPATKPAVGAPAPPATEQPSQTAAEVTAPVSSGEPTSDAGPPPRKIDPPGEELARRIAADLRKNAGSATSTSSPPRSPDGNNAGSSVGPRNELAATLPEYARSRDGKQIAFVRHGENGDLLWLANADGSKARTLFDIQTQKATLDGGVQGYIPDKDIYDPQFSADDRSIYFQAFAGWATSMALYVTRIESRRTTIVVDVNGYQVLASCEKRPSLRGHIIAYRHSYSTFALSTFDGYFLVTPGGKTLGVIGPEPENVERFLQRECSTTSAPPVAVPTIPSRWLGLPPCGNEQVLRYEPLHFLDGTILPIFYFVAPKHARVPFKSLNLDDVKSPPIKLEELEELWQSCASSESR